LGTAKDADPDEKTSEELMAELENDED